MGNLSGEIYDTFKTACIEKISSPNMIILTTETGEKSRKVVNLHFATEYIKHGHAIEILNNCRIQNYKQFLKPVLEEIVATFKHDLVIWYSTLERDDITDLRSVGFEFPIFTQYSPLLYNYRQPRILFVYSPISRENSSITRRNADALYKISQLFENRMEMEEFDYSKYSIYFDPKVYYELAEHLYTDVREISGHLVIDNSFTLQLDKNSILRGRSNNEWSCPMDNGYPIVFHTHPLNAYYFTHFGIGTPSGPDINSSFLYNIHFVFALEAVYYIRYNNQMRNLATYFQYRDKQIYNHLLEMISKVFGYQEYRYLRHLSTHNTFVKYNFIDGNSNVNISRLKDIINNDSIRDTFLEEIRTFTETNYLSFFNNFTLEKCFEFCINYNIYEVNYINRLEKVLRAYDDSIINTYVLTINSISIPEIKSGRKIKINLFNS